MTGSTIFVGAHSTTDPHAGRYHVPLGDRKNPTYPTIFDFRLDILH